MNFLLYLNAGNSWKGRKIKKLLGHLILKNFLLKSGKCNNISISRDGLRPLIFKDLPECSSFMGLPFTVYFKNGTVVKAATSIQNEKQIVNILDDVFKG